MSMRPAAFRRGATRKAMSPALSGREPSSWQFDSRAFRPAFTGLRSPSSPSLAKTRFSSISGTASAMVAIATIFRNDGSRRSRPLSTSKRLRDLEGDASSAQRLAGILAALLVGIDDSQRLRHAFRLRQMMIGDDEVDAAACCGFRRGKGANAGIDADDQANAAVGGLLDHLVAHAVAFANAVRHVVVDLAAAQLESGLQDDDRGGAVDVVVAVDEDGLAALDGGLQSLDGRAQSGHPVRVVKVLQGG